MPRAERIERPWKVRGCESLSMAGKQGLVQLSSRELLKGFQLGCDMISLGFYKDDFG